MDVVWANKSPWKKPGPIMAIAVLNAWSFAAADVAREVRLFVSDDGSGSDTHEDLTSFYGVDLGLAPSLEVVRVPQRPPSLLPRPRAVYSGALGAAKQLLASGRQVLFLTRELGLLPALAALRQRHRGRLTVLHETHDFHADLRQVEAGGGWSRRRQSWCERRVLPHIDGLICITDRQAELYRACFPHLPILVEPLGVLPHDDALAPEAKRARRTVAYVGHLHASKGVQDVYHALPTLAAAGVRLAVFGGRADQSQLASSRTIRVGGQPRPLGDFANFYPFLPPAEMHRLLGAEASLMLVPLKDTPYNRDRTCPVKALDALAHALPSVATDLPSTRQVLGDSARYIPPASPAEMAAAALSILDDPALFDQLSRRAQARALELAWPDRARRIAAFAESLPRHRPRAHPPG